MLGAAFLWRRSIWLVAGLHFAWNTAEQLLGVPVSGHTADARLLNVRTSGSHLLTGGGFGLEASVVPVVIGLLLAVPMFAAARRAAICCPPPRRPEEPLVNTSATPRRPVPPRGARRLAGTAGCLAEDGVLAAVLALLAFVPALSKVGAQLGELPGRPADALSVVLALAQTLPLAARRRFPAAVLAVIGAAFAADQARGYPTTFASLGLYLALYSAGAHQERFRRCRRRRLRRPATSRWPWRCTASARRWASATTSSSIWLPPRPGWPAA